MASFSFRDAVDIQEFNRAIDDGFGEVEVVVRGHRNQYVERRFQQIQNCLVSAYPALENRIRFEEIPLSTFSDVIQRSSDNA